VYIRYSQRRLNMTFCCRTEVPVKRWNGATRGEKIGQMMIGGVVWRVELSAGEKLGRAVC
jgi:hypothetical protein